MLKKINLLIFSGLFNFAIQASQLTPLQQILNNKQISPKIILNTYGELGTDRETIIEKIIKNNHTTEEKRKSSIIKLIELGADINEANGAALFTAISYDKPEIVEILLAAGANPNQINHIDLTPIYVAINKENPTIINLLIDFGANVNEVINVYPPLIAAINQSATNIVEILIRRGANINEPFTDIDGDIKTPLITAIINISDDAHDPEIIKLLINAGANVNQDDNYGYTPLIWAVKYCDQDIIQSLIDHGANINQASYDGHTPLIMAIKKHKTDVIKQLIAGMANVNEISYDTTGTKYTPLSVAMKVYPDIVQLLVGHDA